MPTEFDEPTATRYRDFGSDLTVLTVIFPFNLSFCRLQHLGYSVPDTCPTPRV